MEIILFAIHLLCLSKNTVVKHLSSNYMITSFPLLNHFPKVDFSYIYMKAFFQLLMQRQLQIHIV